MTLGRLRDALLGLGYLALVGSVGVGTWLFYTQAFVDRTEITLTTGTLGNALQEGSDVKLNGVPVGRVDTVAPHDSGAELTLALQPEVATTLPAGTTARLLPKTLFGERYVSLVTPTGTTSAVLEAGGTIAQDASDEAVELEQVFDELLPLLRSIQPDKLSAMLNEMATMLRGNGEDIGATMAAWGRYLDKLNPLVPQMADDFAALGRVAEDYAIAAPDLLEALETMTTTSATMVDQRDQLTAAFANVIAAADDSHGWVTDNSKTIQVLAEESRAALGAVAPYAAQFPCLFEAMAGFVPVMDKTLGKGTDEPGVHVVLNVVPSRGKYLAGVDEPTYQAKGRPRCPYTTGRTGTQPTRAVTPGSTGTAGTAETATEVDPPTIPAPPTSRLQQQFATAGGVGEANSPAENRLIAELVAPTQGLAPAAYPAWSSLLVGPTLRGTEVTLR